LSRQSATTALEQDDAPAGAGATKTDAAVAATAKSALGATTTSSLAMAV